MVALKPRSDHQFSGRPRQIKLITNLKKLRRPFLLSQIFLLRPARGKRPRRGVEISINDRMDRVQFLPGAHKREMDASRGTSIISKTYVSLQQLSAWGGLVVAYPREKRLWTTCTTPEYYVGRVPFGARTQTAFRNAPNEKTGNTFQCNP